EAASTGAWDGSAENVHCDGCRQRRQCMAFVHGAVVAYTVTLKASGHQFAVEAGETVLDAAQRAGLALPYSCRAGLCGSCKAQVLAWHFIYSHNPPTALNAAERAQRAAFVCQPVHVSDMLLEVRGVACVEDTPLRRLDVTLAAMGLLAPRAGRLRPAPGPGAPRLRWSPGQPHPRHVR